MDTLLKLRFWALLPLFAASLDASALQLGRVRGAALIGRPLNIGIPITLEGAAEPDGLCASADIFHGDTRIDPSRMALRTEPGAPGTAIIRVSSPVVVDEPVVVVTLRAGCTERVARRYVLLAEYPSETVPEAPTPAARAAPSTPAARAAPSAPAVPAAQAAPAVTAAPMPPAPALAPALAPAARKAVSPAIESVRRVPAPAPAPSPKPKAQARLKLEPLDLAVERDPALKTSRELRAEPQATPEARARAAALWQALSASPEEAARTTQRVQGLEADVRGLRDLIQKNTAALTLMQEQVEKARSERNLLAIALTGLVVLAIVAGVAALMWSRRRTRKRDEWWHNERMASQERAFFRTSDPPSQPSRPAAVQARPPSSLAPVPIPDFDLSESSADSLYDRLQGAPTRPGAPIASSSAATAAAPLEAQPPAGAQRPASPAAPRPDFLHSMTSSMRMVNAEELIDIRQQAEFFVSLGQPGQAAQVLSAHIHSSPETSALVWLDLLHLYHDEQRRDDYERLRRDFQRKFNAQVPTFDDYRERTKGLENYERALSRIVSLWPRPQVLEVIEESIFRRPGSSGEAAFDLEAYRELVLLFNIAKDVVDDPAAAPMRSAPAAPPVPPAPSTTPEVFDFWAHNEPDRPASVFADTNMEQLPTSQWSSALIRSKSWAEAGDTSGGPSEAAVDIDLDGLSPPE